MPTYSLRNYSRAVEFYTGSIRTCIYIQICIVSNEGAKLALLDRIVEEQGVLPLAGVIAVQVVVSLLCEHGLVRV